MHIERHTPYGEKYLTLKFRNFQEYYDEITRACAEFDRNSKRYPSNDASKKPHPRQQEQCDVNTDLQIVMDHMRGFSYTYEDDTTGWHAKHRKRCVGRARQHKAHHDQWESLESEQEYTIAPPVYDYPSDLVVSNSQSHLDMLKMSEWQESVIYHRCARGIAGADVRLIS